MTIEELSIALDLWTQIKRLQGQLDDLRLGGMRSAAATAPMMGGASGVSAVQIAAELEQEIAKLKKQFDIEREIVRRYINKLELEDVGKKLLTLRYVECRLWDTVAVSLGYSRSQTYQLHADTIKKIGLDRTAPDLQSSVK